MLELIIFYIYSTAEVNPDGQVFIDGVSAFFIFFYLIANIILFAFFAIRTLIYIKKSPKEQFDSYSIYNKERPSRYSPKKIEISRFHEETYKCKSIIWIFDLFYFLHLWINEKQPVYLGTVFWFVSFPLQTLVSMFFSIIQYTIRWVLFSDFVLFNKESVDQDQETLDTYGKSVDKVKVPKHLKIYENSQS